MSADELRELHRRLDTELRQRWQRSLPFDEQLSDRWERARDLGFGEGASIYAASYVYGDVRVGADTWIGPFTVLDGTGGLEIGSTCSISAGVHVYTHDTVQWALTGGAAEYERAAVRIGDACHVGANAVIAPGVTIGDHSVIGAGSFVNRDVPSYTIAVGAPSRPIGRVELEGDCAVLRYD